MLYLLFFEKKKKKKERKKREKWPGRFFPRADTPYWL
jgi:hypothetical protein